MRSFTARFLAIAALAPALLLFVVAVPGCAKQSEGERCGDEIAAQLNSDCEDGLVCKPIGMNNRCCYADGRVNDSRCEASPSSGNGAAGTGGSTGTGGGAGSGGAGSANAGSASVPEAGTSGGDS